MILLILGFLCSVSCQKSNIYFRDIPSNISAISGTDILLPCKAEGDANIFNYQWKQNADEIQLSYRRQLINGSLLIKRTTPIEDDGKYICQVEHLMTGEKISSKEIYVKILWLDNNVSVVLDYPERITQISFTHEIVLKCTVRGSSKIKIDWLRNGERITYSDRIKSEDEKLRIKNVLGIDNGVYRCTGTNEFGTVRSLKNFALILPSNNWATIRVVPEDKIVKERTSARLDCIYENADVLEWYFEEKGPLNNNSRYMISSNNSLLIRNVNKIDEGLYACVGIKRDSTDVPSKYTAILSIAYLGSMNSSFLEPNDPHSHIVAEGKTFQIQCIPPPGNPPPTVNWINPDEKIIGDSGRIKAINHHLIIRNASVTNDGGSYTCRVENLAGVEEVSFDFVISTAPVIKKHPVPKEVDESSDVTMTCEYSGSPYPITRIFWYKDKVPVSNNTSRIFVDVVNGTLYLGDVKINDAGNYYCIVNTSSFIPIKSKYAALTVQPKLKFHPLPMGKKMELGMMNKISCKAEGKDIPFIRWIKGSSIKNAEPFPIHVQDLNGTLHFTKVQQQDKGKYTCIANNSQGEINVTVDVDVVVTPKFIVLPKNPAEGYEGSSIRLDCVAEGDPTPTIQWDNKVIDFTQKRFQLLPNGSLLIDDLHMNDEGYYGCTAGNSGGFNRTEIMLIVRNSDNLRSDGTMDGIEGDTVGKTIVITLGAACAYILLVIILMAWCRYRRRKKKRSYADSNIDSTHLDEDNSKGKCGSRNPVELKETVIVQNGESLCGTNEGENTANSQSSNRSKSLLFDSCENFHFSRKNLHNVMLLGKGEFGNVYLAQNNKNDDVVVMIKVLEETVDEFKRQLDILSNVKHENLIKLIGLCNEEKPYYMILEYTDWGDLKQFLIATRKSSIDIKGNKERPPPLKIHQSLKIVKEAAVALHHLSNMGYTHRDVAARNCLITSSLNIKLTFSSLCKDTYATEYYTIRDQTIPLRWLPYEAVLQNDFSVKTDVYSFACFVWEVFTKGDLPFSKFSNKEFFNLLEKRQIQWKSPKSAPTQLDALLKKCWSLLPTERPIFSQICVELTNLINLHEKE